MLSPILQTHSDNLQEYLTLWSKKQQEIIKTAQKTLETPPLSVPANVVNLARHEELRDKYFWEHLQKAQACLFDLGVCQRSKSTVGLQEKHWLDQARFHLETVLRQSKGSDEDVHGPSPTEHTIPRREVVASEASSCCKREINKQPSTATGLGTIKDSSLKDMSKMTDAIESRRFISNRFHSAFKHLGKLKNEQAVTLELADSPCLHRLVSSFHFDALCGLVVIVNACTIGFSVNYSMTNLGESELAYLHTLEIAFIFFYCVEVLLRGYVSRWNYIFGEDWRWNWFDILLVVVSLTDNVRALHPSGNKSSGTSLGNVSFMRAIRSLKIIRLLRIVQLLKTFKELRLILVAIVGGVRTMFWAILLVTLMQYVAGICFLQGCVQLLHDNPDVSLQTREAIDEYWCTLLRSMNSLFAACTGGLDWYVVADPLYEAGWVYYIFFILYLGFFILVIQNTLTSIFLQATLEDSERDHEMLIQRELENKGEYIGIVKAFFEEIDEDGSGDVTLDEFRRHVGNPKLRIFAESLDIPVEDAEQFFRVLSNNGTVTVDIDTFVVGCIKLRGYSKSVDLFGMYQMLRSVHRKIGELQQQVGDFERELEHVGSKVERQESEMKLAVLHHDLAAESDRLRKQFSPVDKAGLQLEAFIDEDQLCRKAGVSPDAMELPPLASVHDNGVKFQRSSL